MSATDQVWLLAFVVTPAVVVIGAYISVRLFERDLRKEREQQRLHPGE